MRATRWGDRGGRLLLALACAAFAAGCTIGVHSQRLIPDRGPGPERPVAVKAPAPAAKPKPETPDWAKAYEGYASGDIETPQREPKWASSEWRTNQYDTGAVRTQWEVRLTEAGLAVRYGVFRRYFPNGKIEVLGAYKNGQPYGIWTWYDENGALIRKAREGALEEELKGEELRSPLSAFRTPAGQLQSEGQLKATKPHGKWVYYYANGAPSAEGAYLTGVPEGTWNNYYPNGEIERQVRFALGVPDGPYREAYPGGQERERGQYEQGLRTGFWRTFYENGQLQEFGRYQEDRRHGEWDTWSESGELIARTRYDQGAPAEQLPLPAKPPAPQPVIPDIDALPNPPRIYHEDGQRIREREDYDPLPPRPPVRVSPAQRPAPLSQWRDPVNGLPVQPDGGEKLPNGGGVPSPAR